MYKYKFVIWSSVNINGQNTVKSETNLNYTDNTEIRFFL